MKCPNCGQEFEGVRCPNCGQPVKSRGSRVAAVVILIFLVVPAALFGACSAVVALDSSKGGHDAQSWGSMFALFAAGAGIVFLGGLALVVKLWKG